MCLHVYFQEFSFIQQLVSQKSFRLGSGGTAESPTSLVFVPKENGETLHGELRCDPGLDGITMVTG